MAMSKAILVLFLSALSISSVFAQNYINNDVLKRNNIPCKTPGGCKPQQANPYQRGCSADQRCRGGTRSLLEEMKTSDYINNDVMKRNIIPCKTPGGCKPQQANPYQRGCSAGQRCRGGTGLGTQSLLEEMKTSDYINNDVMKRNIIPCKTPGGCKPQQANPYKRGCSADQRCRGGASDNQL